MVSTYKNLHYKNILGLGPPTLRMRPGLAPPSGAWAFKNERNVQAWAAEPKHGQLRICRCWRRAAEKFEKLMLSDAISTGKIPYTHTGGAGVPPCNLGGVKVSQPPDPLISGA